MTTIILITVMITACYFVVALIVAVYKQQRLSSSMTKDRAQQMIISVFDGLVWPFIIIPYGTKKLKQRDLIGGLLLLLISALVISSCFYDTSTPYQDEKKVEEIQTLPPIVDNSNEQIDGYQTLVIGSDGCDYIYWRDGSMGAVGGLTHSGSCRKCWARLNYLFKVYR